jgi:23S rRNA (adenine2503-C2)-methyltransferase
MGCTFCETGRLGLMKSLSAAEIIAQWFIARHHFRGPIGNIVFMGMGEPMENIEAVVQSIRIFTDRNGPAIAPSHIAVSTVGRIAGIDRYRELASEPGLRQLKLAISINAPNDEIRSSIMPINRAEPMGELRQAMERWRNAQLSAILVEYVLIPDVNDRAEHADELAEYLRGIACKVNVIPYNPRRDSPWPAPSEERVKAFIERLRAAGMFVKRRRTLGRSVMAACGQLGNEKIRQRRFQVQN